MMVAGLLRLAGVTMATVIQLAPAAQLKFFNQF